MRLFVCSLSGFIANRHWEAQFDAPILASLLNMRRRLY